jgi:hypothetical protein
LTTSPACTTPFTTPIWPVRWWPLTGGVQQARVELDRPITFGAAQVALSGAHLGRRGRTFESCRAHGLNMPFSKARNAEKCTIRPSYSASAPTGQADQPCPGGARGEGVLGQPDGGARGQSPRRPFPSRTRVPQPYLSPSPSRPTRASEAAPTRDRNSCPPTSSTRNLAKDKVLREALGNTGTEDYLDYYFKTRQAEWTAYQEQVTPWEVSCSM